MSSKNMSVEDFVAVELVTLRLKDSNFGSCSSSDSLIEMMLWFRDNRSGVLCSSLHVRLFKKDDLCIRN